VERLKITLDASRPIREVIRGCPSDDLDAEVDRRIVEGYRRLPQTGDEDAWAEANARAAIREEPWSGLRRAGLRSRTDRASA
jgi:hypothetical protein